VSRGPVATGCRFCELPDRDRVLRIDQTFAVMLSLGPLVSGHFMLVARDHHQSSAELPQGEIRLANQVIQRILVGLRNRYGEYTAFEHGRAGACVPPGHGEDHCYHAHVHFLPKDVNLVARARADYDFVRFDDWQSFQRAHSERPVPYLAVWDGDDVWAAFDPKDLPHHYLRTKVAEALGEPLFGDWAAFPRLDDVELAKSDPALDFLRELDLS